MADDRTGILRTEREELERVRELEKEIRRIRQESSDDDDKLLNKYQQRIKRQEEFIESVKAEFEERGEISRELKDQIERQTGIRVQMSLTKKEAAELVTKLQDANKQLEERNAYLKDGVDSAESFLQTTFGIKKVIDLQNLSLKGLGEKFQGMAQGAWNMLNPLNLAASAMQTMALLSSKAVGDFINLSAELSRASGAADAFDDAIFSTFEQTRNIGASLEDVAKGMGSMIDSVSGFSKMSDATKVSLAALSIEMERVGVSGAETAGIVQELMFTLGAGAEETELMIENMMGLATQVGIPPAKMAADFKSALPQLAVFGKRAGAIFQKLSVQAQKLGTSTEQLLSITSQFDTFDGAAEAAARLNAVLGGPYLSSIKMIAETDPTKRIEMLAAAFEKSGKSIDNLGYYEQQQLAASLNISVVELNKQFGEQAKELKNVQKELDSLGPSQESLENAQMEGTALTEKWNVLLNQFVVALQPVAETINDVITAILKWQKENPEAFKTIVKVVAAVTLLVGGLFGLIFVGGMVVKMVKSVFAPLKFLTGLFGSTKKAVDETSDSGGNMGKSFGEALKEIMEAVEGKGEELRALALVFLSIGAAIGLAALGMSTLVAAFAKLENLGQIVGALAAMVVVFVGMGVMLKVLIPVIAAFAATAGVAAGPVAALALPIFAIGAAVALAAYGMSLLVAEFGKLPPEKILAIGSGIFLMAVGITALTAALLGLATTAAIVGTAVVALFGIFVGLSLFAFGLSEIFDRIAESVNNITADKAIAVKEMLAVTGQVLVSAANTGESVINNVEKVVEVAGKYQEVQSNFKTADKDAFLQAIKSLSLPGTTGGRTQSGAGQTMTVNLVLDGKVIDKKIVNVIAGEFGLT
jgi:hypothetical protein